MKLMYSLGGARPSRVYLEACVGYVTPATMVIESPSATVPILLLEYDLAELEAVGPILAAMQKADAAPDVHIWDLHKEAPEVAVVFRAKNPSAKLLGDVAGKVGEPIKSLATRFGCAEVSTIAEVNLSRKDVLKFMQDYARHRCAVVDVYERHRRVDGEHLQRFVVPEIRETRPIIQL